MKRYVQLSNLDPEVRERMRRALRIRLPLPAPDAMWCGHGSENMRSLCGTCHVVVPPKTKTVERLGRDVLPCGHEAQGVVSVCSVCEVDAG